MNKTLSTSFQHFLNDVFIYEICANDFRKATDAGLMLAYYGATKAALSNIEKGLMPLDNPTEQILANKILQQTAKDFSDLLP